MKAKKTNRQIPTEILQAFEAIESGYLDDIVRRRRPADFDALRAVLADDQVDKKFLRKAIYALGKWQDRKAVDDIVRVIPDIDNRTRVTAIDALTRLGGKKSREAIEAYADSPDPQIRKFVVTGLEKIGGRSASKRLKSIARGDKEKWVRDLASGKRPDTGGSPGS